MKAFVATLLVLILGDLAINHGAATHSVVQTCHGFFQWMASAGDESIFSR